MAFTPGASYAMSTLKAWEGLPAGIEILVDFDKTTGKITKLYGFPRITGVDASFRNTVEVDELREDIAKILGLSEDDLFDDENTAYESCYLHLMCNVYDIQDYSKYDDYYAAYHISFNNFTTLVIKF